MSHHRFYMHFHHWKGTFFSIMIHKESPNIVPKLIQRSFRKQADTKQSIIQSDLHLAMVVRQQKPLLVPVDWVIRISDHTAVYERVSSSHRGDVLHRTNPWRTWWTDREETERKKREEEKEKIISWWCQKQVVEFLGIKGRGDREGSWGEGKGQKRKKRT